MNTKTTVASSLSIAAAVILIVALFLGWYTVSATEMGPASYGGTRTFYLGETFYQGWYCNGLSPVCTNGSVGSTYSGVGMNHTGLLYAGIEVVVVIGIALGITGGMLRFFLSNGKRSSWATYVILAALIMAILAPIGLALLQPSALSQDGYAKSWPASPATSFLGSCSGSACLPKPAEPFSRVSSWGPEVGWYLPFVAFALFLVSVLVARAGLGRNVASSTSATSSRPAR
jgi:hypothetical protein